MSSLPVPRAALVVMLLAAAPGVTRSAADDGPRERNLQVLPADISQDSLQLVMSEWASALGVRCSHCHVSSREHRDFAADDKAPKHMARRMVRLVAQINGNLDEALGAGVTPVRCVTCHRGVALPQTLQDLLLEALDAGGIDAATARYRDLRQRYYGRAAYDFGENALLDIAGHRARAGDDYAAIEFLRLNLAFYPESVFTLTQLGGALHRIGAIDEARLRFDEALRLDPDNRWTRRQMDRLFGGDASD